VHGPRISYRLIYGLRTHRTLIPLTITIMTCLENHVTESVPDTRSEYRGVEILAVTRLGIAGPQLYHNCSYLRTTARRTKPS